MANAGAEAVRDCLPRYVSLLMAAWSQTGEGQLPSKAPKLLASDGNVRWSDWTAMEVYGHYRALPGRMYSFMDGKCVKLTKMNRMANYELADDHPLQTDENEFAPGYAHWDTRHKVLFVKCKRGWVVCEELHVVGKRPGSAADFANAFGLRKGEPKSFEYIDRDANTS